MLLAVVVDDVSFDSCLWRLLKIQKNVLYSQLIWVSYCVRVAGILWQIMSFRGNCGANSDWTESSNRGDRQERPILQGPCLVFDSVDLPIKNLDRPARQIQLSAKNDVTSSKRLLLIIAGVNLFFRCGKLLSVGRVAARLVTRILP